MRRFAPEELFSRVKSNSPFEDFLRQFGLIAIMFTPVFVFYLFFGFTWDPGNYISLILLVLLSLSFVLGPARKPKIRKYLDPIAMTFGRMAIKFAFILIPLLVVSLLVAVFVEGRLDSNISDLLSSIAGVLFATFGYIVYCKVVEKRPALELHARPAIFETILGLLIGAGLITVVVLLMYSTGVLQFHGFNAPSSMANFLGPLLIAGFVEEYIFRGVLFKLTEEGLGTWLALLIQAFLFGFIHHSNPNASLLSSLAIALEAGLLLAAVFMITRRLWMAIGIHFAWNWMQGPFYGIPVSGHDINGFIETSISGNELLSGGAFGAEASIFAMLTCTITGLIFLFFAIRKGDNLVKPMWKREKNNTIEDDLINNEIE